MDSPFEKPIILAYPLSLTEVLVESIRNPLYFLRDEPSREEIEELANSLQCSGLINPIVVSRLGDGFRLVTGYRRLLAAKRLGWEKIPACVIEANESNEIIISLAENLDRKDVDPLRVAEALRSLHLKSGLPLKDLAARLKKSPEWLSNLLRILQYSAIFSEGVKAGDLSLQHCLEICTLGNAESMERAVRFARKVKPNVRVLREYVKLLKRIHEIKEALRGCESQEKREQLTAEMKNINDQLNVLEGMKKRIYKTKRSNKAACDLCEEMMLRRDIHSVKLCPLCYQQFAAWRRNLAKEEKDDRLSNGLRKAF
jgi:ParB family chromosome partitioning protein